jgi:hypothetical protein
MKILALTLAALGLVSCQVGRGPDYKVQMNPGASLPWYRVDSRTMQMATPDPGQGNHWNGWTNTNWVYEIVFSPAHVAEHEFCHVLDNQVDGQLLYLNRIPNYDAALATLYSNNIMWKEHDERLRGFVVLCKTQLPPLPHWRALAVKYGIGAVQHQSLITILTTGVN